MNAVFLPGLPVDLIIRSYAAAPGNEIEQGRFANPEGSAVLAANTFGLFLEQPSELPALPGTGAYGWPARRVRLEASVSFPWHGGRHPWLDVLIETQTALIGVEAKRFEPFRTKSRTGLSDAYDRPVWGDSMRLYESLRDRLRATPSLFSRLNATQLVKHAFGLRTAGAKEGLKPVLCYLYAEPRSWPDSRPVPTTALDEHRSEVQRFAEWISGDEVAFYAFTYSEMLIRWARSAPAHVRGHADAVMERFSP